MIKKKSLNDDDFIAADCEEIDEKSDINKDTRILPTLSTTKLQTASTKLFLKINKEHKMISSKDIIPKS